MESGQRIEFHNVKTPAYQTQHADGALGGITPNGLVYVSFYLERMATPQRLVLEVEGDKSRVVEHEGKKGLVREINSGVVMTPKVAEELVEFLQGLIDQARTRPKEDK